MLYFLIFLKIRVTSVFFTSAITNNRITSNYRPQTKFAKVMFLHPSVSHSVHRGGVKAQAQGVSRPGAVCPAGVSRPKPGGSRPRPRRVSAWGVEALGVSRPRGWVSQHALRQTPLPTPQTATAADGTHPSGMHSWLRRCSVSAMTLVTVKIV